MNSATKISEEISSLGYCPRVLLQSTFNRCDLVIFHYDVMTGRYKGNTFDIFLANEANIYPEYPPHFVGISELSDHRIPLYTSVDVDGRSWAVFSCPPNDFWDDLRPEDKNMRT